METNSVKVTSHGHYCDQDSGQMTGNPEVMHDWRYQAESLSETRSISVNVEFP
jgi:hypothetical protein